ncbi:hypothetical protein Lal_00039534 [Lupinus albus]|nr:hypothetical protein Lal_00039534 [Lupinus albus]
MKTNPSQANQKCATIHYHGAISLFKNAKVHLVRDPITASHDARLAGNGPHYCADAINVEKINDQSIFYINKALLLLSDIASVAARKLVNDMK